MNSFPQNFLWGAATSAHQVEGGNSLNDWWAWEQSGRVPVSSGTACDHYRRFESDLDLARQLAHNAYRFSLEWSRIEPAPGHYSDEALDHYARVVSACRARNLEPIVTLHHFTNPRWFAAQGGWASPKSVEAFARYVETVAQRLGSKIRWWITINEPTSFLYQGYITGVWPPGRKNDWRGALVVTRHLVQAHRAAYEIVHRLSAGRDHLRPRVGFAHHMIWYAPCNPRSPYDRLATHLRNVVANQRFLRACRGAIDFIGLNYYTRDFVHWAGWGPLALLGTVCSLEHHRDAGPRNSLGWEIYPEGLYTLLTRLKVFQLPILVTENGVCAGEDPVRQEFIRHHLHQMGRAMARGVPVVGYLHWSLMDNFEWAEGFTPRFGLIEIDYATQARRIRSSALTLAQLIRTDRFPG